MKTKSPLPKRTNAAQASAGRKNDTVKYARALKKVSHAGAFRPLNKSSFEPFYIQILTQLKRLIDFGEIGIHDPLPSEMDIARIFGVSRMTARQALQSLTYEGLAYRERGRGTFIAPAKVEEESLHHSGFSAEMKLSGLKTSTQVLTREVIPASSHIPPELELQSGSEVLHLRCLLFAGKAPVALEEVWIPLARFPGIPKRDFSKRFFYESVRKNYFSKVGSAKEIIEARPASAEELRLMHITPKISVLVVSRTLLDVEAHPMEVSHSLYRGDRYQAMITISARVGNRHRRASHE